MPVKSKPKIVKRPILGKAPANLPDTAKAVDPVPGAAAPDRATTNASNGPNPTSPKTADRTTSDARAWFDRTPTEISPTTPAVNEVNVVNVKNEGGAIVLPKSGSRVYSEPVMRWEKGAWVLDYVGEHDTDSDRLKLFHSNGTPGTFMKPGMIFLPTGETEYGDGATLHEETLAFINRYVELPPGMDVLATGYIRLTWLFDAFSEVPYLRFRSMAFGMGKSRALEVVGSLCRRATMISGASSPSSIRRIVDLCGGTLLVDEGDLDERDPAARVVTKMLLTGFQRGRQICLNEPNANGSWTPRAFEVFGPKVLAHHERFARPALESRFVDCLMGEKTRKLPLNLPQPQFDQEALDLRNKYLAYRRDHLSHVCLDPKLARSELEDRTNQIALPLLSVMDEPSDREAVVQALLAGQQRVKDDVGSTVEGAIASELLDVHRTVTVPLAVLAASVGEQFDLKARQLGGVCRRMGLTVRHTRQGNVVVLDPKARQQLRALLRRPPPHILPSPCSPRSPGRRVVVKKRPVGGNVMPAKPIVPPAADSDGGAA